MLDYGIFYEFIPMDTFGTDQKSNPFSWCRNFLKLCDCHHTNSGLWRYLIGDTVRFTSLALTAFSDRKNKTPHQRIWRRVNGRKYRSELLPKPVKWRTKLYTVAPFSWLTKKKERMNGWLNLKRLKMHWHVPKHIRRNITKSKFWLRGQTNNNMTLNPLVINVARKNLFYDWLKQKINWRTT
jgi:hypothetical protein